LPLSAKSFRICEKLLKTGKIGSCRLSKSASWLWLPFKIGELALTGFQNRRNGSGQLSKALGAAMRNLLSNRSKGFELAGFKSFSQIQKVSALNGKEFINSI
jgi:hypothetical protein